MAKHKPNAVSISPSVAPPARTGAARWADGVLEACLLAAVVVVPIYFNPRTERVFEPDKLAWLVLLALLAGWALVVRSAEGWTGWRKRRPSALVWAAGAFGLAWWIGMAASTVPIVSFWGSYHRAQGIVVYAAYLVAFAAAALVATRPTARERLRRAVIWAAVPVALYAVFQRFRIDSIQWDIYGEGSVTRAYGTLGNAIFLGSYLLLVAPLAAVGAIEAWAAHRAGARGALRVCAGHVLALVLALAGLAAAQSRGPVLGLLVAAGLAALVWAASARRRNWVVALAAAGAVGVALMVVSGRTDTTPLGRLGSLFATGSRTAQERMFVWDALERLVREHPVRALVGYGPETTYFTLQSYLSRDLIQLVPSQVFDRAHNVLWEAWISAGLLGVLALLGVYVAAFYVGYRELGLLAGRRSGFVLAGAMYGGAALGFMLPRVVGMAPLSMVGAVFGLLAGAAGYAVVAAVTGWGRPAVDANGANGTSGRSPSARSWLVLGVLAAMAGHLAAGSVGLPMAAGELLFWVYAGLLLSVERSRGVGEAGGAEEAGGARDSGRNPATASRKGANVAADFQTGAASASDLALALADPPRLGARQAEGVVEGLALASVLFAPLLQPAVAGSALAQGHGRGLWWLLPATWLVAQWLAPPPSAGPRGEGAFQAGLRWLLPKAVAAVAVVVFFDLIYLVVQSNVGGPIVAFAFTLVAAVLAAAFGLSRDREAVGSTEPWRWVPYTALAVIFSVGAWWLAVRPTLADAHIRAGLQAGVDNKPAELMSHFERAQALWPEQPTYATYTAGAYLQRMLDANLSAEERVAAFKSGEAVLLRSFAQSPNDQIVSRLGTLYRYQGDLATDPNERQRLYRDAGNYYSQAMHLYPLSQPTQGEFAGLLERTEQVTQALETYTEVARLDPANDDAATGRLRVLLTLGDVPGAEKALDEMLALHQSNPAEVEQAIQRGASLPAGPLRSQQSHVMYLARTGKQADAEKLLGELEASGPDDASTKALREWLRRTSPP